MADFRRILGDGEKETKNKIGKKLEKFREREGGGKASKEKVR